MTGFTIRGDENLGMNDPQCAKTPDTNCPTCKGTGIIEGVKEHQIGFEKTPEEYVARLVEIFHEVRRVLRDDGTLWLNLGDTYVSSSRKHITGRMDKHDPKGPTIYSRPQFGWEAENTINEVEYGLKPKDLIGIPWRVAFALQADGWYLRCDIIWAKPNPMPESVIDRPTKSHEYIFLLTKSARYFYDQEAIREPNLPNSGQTGVRKKAIMTGGELKLRPPNDRIGCNPSGRNKRSVWSISTQPYPDAHFAVFPEEIPRTCILAGTSRRGCCANCGAPWERVLDKKRPEGWKDAGPTSEKEKGIRAISQGIYGGNQKSRSISDIFGRATKSEILTLGWQPTCKCGCPEVVPCVVLDPFAGTGTTGQVARDLGRRAILIELNPVYAKMIEERAKTNLPNIIDFG